MSSFIEKHVDRRRLPALQPGVSGSHQGEGSGRPSSPPPFPGDAPRVGTPEDYGRPSLKDLAEWETLAERFNGKLNSSSRNLAQPKINFLLPMGQSPVSQALFQASLRASGWRIENSHNEGRDGKSLDIIPGLDRDTTPGPIPLPHEMKSDEIPGPDDLPRYSYKTLYRMEGAIANFSRKFRDAREADPYASRYSFGTRFDQIPPLLRDAYLQHVASAGWQVTSKQKEHGGYDINITKAPPTPNR